MDDAVPREAPESVEAPDALVRVTVTMTRGQHRAVKGRARELGISVSELVRTWVSEAKDSRLEGD